LAKRQNVLSAALGGYGKEVTIVQINLLRRALLVLPLTVFCLGGALAQTRDPLPSWNDGAAKKSIIDFVARVTTPGSPDFVPVERRVATFDNDGTLWTEQPIYTQVVFTYDHLRTVAAEHPEWKNEEPLKSLLELEPQALLGEKALLSVVAVAHKAITVDEFSAVVLDWLATARHPRFNRPYTDLVYQPMLEVIEYLRANDFKVFIVSGGGIEFMRPWTEKVYGIPPERVVGSSGFVKFQMGADGKPMLLKQADVEFTDDGPGKPIGIERFIGRRPIFAFGNSDHDLPMLEWTAAGDGARFIGYVHHTDADREYAYDRGSKVGQLDKGLDIAAAKGWTVADMKRDWKVIYPFQK
jgi:haloacid dehalogenase-like hydrolase